MKPTKEEIKAWLKRFGHSRDWLGQKCGGLSLKAVNNWLSTDRSVPASSLEIIRRLMADDERAEAERVKSESTAPLSHLVIKVDSDEFNAWEKIALQQQPPQTVTDYCVAAIRAAYEEEMQPVPFAAPPARPHLHAAAGSPISAEVTDWDGAGNTVMVKISGLSMTPLLNDGDVIPMKHKRASRSPFMKKGLIYLVAYDGGYTVKRYNTRPATPEELGEEWAEKGKVRVLESINPAFPEIIIRQPVEWVAWLDKADNI